MAANEYRRSLYSLMAEMYRADKVLLDEDFQGYGYALATPPAGWAAIDTSAAGAPTIAQAATNGGGVICTLAANSEAEACGLNRGDGLCYDVDQVKYFEARFLSPTLTSVQTIVIGMTSAHNDDPDAITAGAWLHIPLASAIKAESDDGTTDNDDISTGKTLGASVWCSALIDFSTKTNVKFYLDVLGNGKFERVAPATTFTLAAYTANLQPAAWIKKASGTTTPALTVDYMRVCGNRR